MDKLLSRALRAKAQAARRLKKVNEAAAKRRMNNARKEHTAFQSLLNVDRRTSRTEEKEDHRLGPLKPRRAVGAQELELFGSFDQQRIIPPAVPRAFRIRYWNIVEKDRVVILRGPDRHKIGVVKNLDKLNNTLLVEGMNLMPLQVPDAFKSAEEGAPSVILREAPIHYNDVRLVLPLHDPETDTMSDTIVANISMSSVFHDRHSGETKWTRYIAGTDTEIPWHEVEEKEAGDQPGDTRVMFVENATYLPTLFEPPFPLSVMDELRNKYSKFRTRHEPEFIAAIEESERLRLEKEGRKIRTPMQEFNRALRAQKKAKGPPVLTESIMEQIGRVMAQNRPELLVKVKPAAELQTA